MKLSKKAKKQLETANKAFDGAKATMKIYEKRFSKVFDKFGDIRFAEDRHLYTEDVKRVTKYINEGNTMIGNLQMNLKDARSASKRFKYMSYNDITQMGLHPDDIKSIRQRLNKIVDDYQRMITQVNKIQFDMIRTALSKINTDIMVDLNSDFYECKVRMFRMPCVDTDWYLNGEMVCSTEERPYYASVSAPVFNTVSSSPKPVLSRDLSEKTDATAIPITSTKAKSFMSALVDCAALPSDVPGEIIGVSKEEVTADTETLKHASTEKPFHITEDKKE